MHAVKTINYTVSRLTKRT